MRSILEKNKTGDDMALYIENQEYIANNYVMKCFAVTMLVYTTTLLLNVAGIFVIDQKLMFCGYIPSLIIYFITLAVSKFVSLSNRKMKYFILFSIISVFTIAGVSITYHIVLAALFPFVYATFYSSKPVMRYVCVLTFLSTIIVIYGGYYFGLCDANMVLLTTDCLQSYVSDGRFILSEVNPNPAVTLFLYFIMPRSLIFIAFMVVCNSLFRIVSGSIEKARLTAELEKAKMEAENANNAKTKFLARMSHEIRTPINAVLGMNELILRESSESKIREYAYDVKDASVMLLNIVNEILDSSKIESGRMEIVEVDYEMGSVLNDLYNMLTIKANEKNLCLIFDIDREIPSAYYGDDRRIRQVLINLLVNGIKYTDKGNVTLKLSCDIEDDNAVLHFAVVDTGIGIKAENIGKIYDEFQRFDMERNRNVEGTGLGMNITQQFLKLMGSELNIKSEYGKGSEFSFDIVQKIVNAKPLGDFRNKGLTDGNENDVCGKYSAPNAKVLVVDDSKINLKVFSNLIKDTRINISEAESGEECLDILKNQKFDLIFLDHMMPGMDGIETLHAMREQKLCEGVPVIMLTANAIVGDREKYLSEGFDDFISKPIIPDKLNQMLLKYIPKDLIVNSETADNGCKLKGEQKNMMESLRESLTEIDFDSGLATCSGDEKFYLELLHDFTHLPIREELAEYFHDNDNKNYCIRIHGFKNNAYSVGAIKLGDLAYEMEKISKEGLTDKLAELENDFIRQFSLICSKYHEIAGKTGNDKRIEVK